MPSPVWSLPLNSESLSLSCLARRLVAVASPSRPSSAAAPTGPLDRLYPSPPLPAARSHDSGLTAAVPRPHFCSPDSAVPAARVLTDLAVAAAGSAVTSVILSDRRVESGPARPVGLSSVGRSCSHSQTHDSRARERPASRRASRAAPTDPRAKGPVATSRCRPAAPCSIPALWRNQSILSRY